MVSVDQYKKKASSSIKWTIVGELFAKLIVPITNMILARLLSPSIFGIVASITVITNFAEILSDSGFSRYILQHKFESEQIKKESVGTATVISFFISCLIFLVIAVASKPLSDFVGAKGYENVLMFAAAQIPFFAVTSIQISVFRRDFKFGSLAIVRVSSCVIQLITSSLVAFLGMGIWSIPVGTLASLICQFLLMVIFDRRSLSISFSAKALKGMWACSGMFLISSIVIWADSSINVLFASHFLGQAESGFIKNGFSTASGIISLLTAIYSPVFISLLAKFDCESKDYLSTFYKYQKALSSLFIPLGIGMFVFQSFFSLVFFGDGWEPAAIALGCMSLVGCIRAATGNFILVAWTAKGSPFWIFLADLFSCFSLIIAWLTTRSLGYSTIVVIVSAAYFPTNIFCFALCKKTLGISPLPIIKNAIECFGPAVLMGFFGYLLSNIYSNFIASALYIFLCMVFYFLILGFSYPDYLISLLEVFAGPRLSSLFAKKRKHLLPRR